MLVRAQIWSRCCSPTSKEPLLALVAHVMLKSHQSDNDDASASLAFDDDPDTNYQASQDEENSEEEDGERRDNGPAGSDAESSSKEHAEKRWWEKLGPRTRRRTAKVDYREKGVNDIPARPLPKVCMPCLLS